jgi:hypothetical protein
LLNLPEIGKPEILSITLKTVPVASVADPLIKNESYCRNLETNKLEITLDLQQFVRFSKNRGMKIGRLGRSGHIHIKQLRMLFVLTAAIVASTSFASAATIVNWGGNYVSMNVPFRRSLSFSDTLPLNPISNYAGTSQVFYGGAQTANGLTGFTDSGPFSTGVNNTGNSNQLRDSIMFYWQGSPSATTEGVILWKKANFLGTTNSATIYFDSQSSLFIEPNSVALPIRFVVQDGTTYYISNVSYSVSTSQTVPGTATLTDPNNSTTWAPYNPSANIDFDASTATFSRHSFTNIQAVGYYFEFEMQGFAEVPFSVQQFTVNASVTVEDQNASVQYDDWRGFKSASANGGYYRMSNVTGDMVGNAFAGTSITWITRKAPTMGIASVTIDGISRGTYDLYSPNTLWKQQILFDGLTNASHKIAINVTGMKNAAASDYNVALDGLIDGTSTNVVQENATTVQYNNWVGKNQSAASGGSYRVNSEIASAAVFRFKGTSISFITARGPSYGLVNIYIDGVLHSSNLDLYAPSQQWQYRINYSGLTNGNHTIEVQPTHTKNPNSSGYAVVVDAFTGPFTPLL